MRVALLALLLSAPLMAQPAAEPAKPAAASDSPVASSESWVTGSVDLGYRWRTDPAGNFNAYRSIVDLGSGPKLLGAEFTIQDPKHRLFDRVEARAYNWGDDPYTTVHVNARKTSLYDFNADYRNIAYFNNLPSFADPLLSRGIVLNERSFDIRRRFSSFDLELFPGRTIVPYFGYHRSSGFGNGISTFVTGGNEYPVPSKIGDSMDDYRGGVRLEYRRMHFDLEQGGTMFRDDQQLFDSGLNKGNVNTPILGQQLFLTKLLQSYQIRGASVYSKGSFTANPVSWLDVTAQILYSQPHTDVTYQQSNTGSFVNLSEVLFYSGQQYLLSAVSKVPRTSGNLGIEIRPLPRVRILESWQTDRLHTASSNDARQSLLPAGIAQPAEALLNARLITNYSQEQVNVMFDATAKLTLRGGYRFEWGDASNVVLPLAGLAGLDSGKLRRNIGIGGFSFRPLSQLSFSGEFEGASSDQTYFRTSLHEYQRMHARAQFQVLASLLVAADFSLLSNQNPAAGSQYDYLTRQNSISVHWLPKGGRIGFDADYSRSTVRSDILFFAPQTLTPERSFYRDNAHLASVLLNVPLPRGGKISAGGALAVTSGSRPTTYLQPLGTLTLPISKHASWVSQWRYYGYGESFYAYEGFRTHLVTTGLKLTR
jgi:hypothetical protein